MKLCKPSTIVVNLLYACCWLVPLACYKTGNVDNDSSIPANTDTDDTDVKERTRKYDHTTAGTEIATDSTKIGSDADTDHNNKTKTKTDTEIEVTTDVEKRTDARPPAIHRPVALSCENVHSPPDLAVAPDDEFGICNQHADCTEGDNGKCITSGIGMGGNYRFCVYDDCLTDADCDPGRVCYCTPSYAARCLYVGNCQVDADCGPGGYCSPSQGHSCTGYLSVDGYHCKTPADTCIDDADCTGSDYCGFNPHKNSWECTPIDITCAIG